MGILFCRECKNMLYPKVDRDGFLYVCERCDLSVEPPSNVISSVSLKSRHAKDKQHVQSLFFDPTLPRLNKACPNCGHGICVSYMEKTEEKALDSYYVCNSCFYEWAD